MPIVIAVSALVQSLFQAPLDGKPTSHQSSHFHQYFYISSYWELVYVSVVGPVYIFADEAQVHGLKYYRSSHSKWEQVVWVARSDATQSNTDCYYFDLSNYSMALMSPVYLEIVWSLISCWWCYVEMTAWCCSLSRDHWGWITIDQYFMYHSDQIKHLVSPCEQDASLKCMGLFHSCRGQPSTVFVVTHSHYWFSWGSKSYVWELAPGFDSYRFFRLVTGTCSAFFTSRNCLLGSYLATFRFAGLGWWQCYF